MLTSSVWAERLGLEIPVVQAGMGGGLSTSQLAAAVSGAGGLGTVGIMRPRAFAAELSAARRAAPGRPVCANLLVPFTRRAHVRACVEAQVPLVALHGGFAPLVVGALRRAGIEVLHQVGTVEEARRAVREGATGVIVQGLEAGGHLHGVAPVTRMLPAIRAALPEATPVLATGGVAEGHDVRRLLALGADAAVAGTRFLATPESGAHPAYKQALVEATRTLHTLLFGFGWPMRHRVLPNAATQLWCRRDPRGPRVVRAFNRLSAPVGRALPLELLTWYPHVQHPALPLFTPGPPVDDGGPERVLRASALYAGESVARITEVVPAAEVVARLSR